MKTVPEQGIESQADAALVARARRGDTAAFEMLAQRHVRMVIALIRQRVRNGEAEDLAQETLLSAYRNLAQLKDDSRFAFWLYRIAIRKAGSSRRVGKLESSGLSSKLESQQREEDPPFGEELKQSVRAAVASLEEPYRLVVTLRYLEGLDATEIGRRLNIPPATARARLARAMPMLQQKLRSVCHAPTRE
jgi:RNA polymerase sigma-70 factor (ECF subfamily)